MKKSLLKGTAIAVCFALLLLAFPNVIQAQPRTAQHFFEKFIRTPFAIFAEFMSFLPIVDMPLFQAPNQTTNSKTVTRKFSKNMKVTGDINRGRTSGND
jgi:hypothetical protein